MTQASGKTLDLSSLDSLTGGAFTAPTSGERAARVREWLASDPPLEQLQEVFRELSARDKGAARPLREKLDDLRRAKEQEATVAEWAEKAQTLLGLSKLNIADALAWQRDAAKAGAPLSREPLASVKVELAERVRIIEDLQHRVHVQREAAVLLAQRIEVLSTKSWKDAQAALEPLVTDVAQWQQQAEQITADPNWSSVDAKFPPQLDTSKAQLLVVWEAFQAALAQTIAAADDATAALPPVAVWADELRAARGEAAGAATPEAGAKPAKPKVDPAVLAEQRAKASTAVREALAKLQQETAEGHGRASAGAAGALRAVLREHGRHVDNELEAEVHGALVAAGELEGWQRWRADQLREELVAKAEGLLNRPEGQALGGRKLQEQLRTLREQWKETDQGGVPNHALWKRFDEACNKAYKQVEVWLEKIKSEAAAHRAQRLALIEEVKAWAADNRTAKDGDWKGFNRILHQFSERWREGGHISEKAFAELQPQWKAALHEAGAPLDAEQKASSQRRHAMIEEATVLGNAPQMRIDAVKALQQRWQAEAQHVPLDRKHEQKLWDAFRKPIDDAFQRKTDEREKAAAATSEHDRAVLEAAKAVDAATASGDAQQIRSAVQALEAAMQGRRQAETEVAAAKSEEKAPEVSAESGDVAPESEATPVPTGEGGAAPAPAPKPARPVVAVRGDDRPGMKKAEPAPAGRDGRPGRPGDRRDGRGPGAGRPGGDRGGDRFDPRGGDRFGRPPREERGPRLGDAAFRAQRDAIEHAQGALRKLAAQAHGEVLSRLMTAWEQRDAAAIPPAQELGSRVSASARGAWTQAIGAAASGDAQPAVLRLEMAAELPTPAAHLDARRALQLQLLTRRNDPSPTETWAHDVASVLATPFQADEARRVQNALKVLLKR